MKYPCNHIFLRAANGGFLDVQCERGEVNINITLGGWQVGELHGFLGNLISDGAVSKSMSDGGVDKNDEAILPHEGKTLNLIHFAYSKDKQEPSTMKMDHGQWLVIIRQTDGSLLLAFDTLEDWQAFQREINTLD